MSRNKAVSSSSSRRKQQDKFKDFIFKFRPKTRSQEEAQELFETKSVLFLSGVAGTGKSFAAVALALEHVFAGRCQSPTDAPVVITRPIIEASGEKLGFLPGTAEEKLDPYLQPAFAIFEKLKLQAVMPEDASAPAIFKSVPLALMRGWTFPNVAVLEEAQNCTEQQLLLFLTRLGKGGKMLITCDPTQFDRQELKRPAVLDVIKKLRDLDEVGVVHMPESDVMRDPFVAKVIKRIGPKYSFE